MSKEQSPMTFTGHLDELRQRLIKSVIALIITTLIAFVFAKVIFGFLIAPAGDVEFIYTELTGFIGPYMKVALIGGIVLAMPVLVYQAIMFVSPALTQREKRYVYLALPWITIMFVAGLAFGYYVLVPPALRFLLNFGGDIASPAPRIGNYVTFITRFLLAIGVVFELPVIITFLSRLGIVTPQWLAGKRRWAIIGAFILAAIITPTFDPINQSLVAVPLIILYEMSILLSKVAYRKRAESEETYLSEE
ncbi:MAG: twin-arginine translocase subunit TatC [Chloroflexota bacterium]|nr:twin-arginine translocase subunit TatC [Chloroflexota bacterium]